jgi:hypothetical protein
MYFANIESYDGQVHPKIYEVKPMFDHLMQKFPDNYISEDQLMIAESLL